ncbi:MAG: tetratricopeptide repeat protein [Candidatus Omnitrophica bacterium]|nr:tetratricopeptide repeat protein [Candidatus Omnitrophota bacterium]
MRKWILVILAVMMMAPMYATADQKQDKQAIIDELSAFSDTNPNAFAQVVYLLGDSYHRDNKIDKAIALYEKAANVITGNEDILNRLGNLYNQKQDYAKAADIYQKLAGLKPDNAWYVQMLSASYKNAGQKDKAVLVWENLTKNSKNAEVFMQAANFYNDEKDTEKAIAAIKKAIELAPDNVGYLQVLEGFYMRAEKFSDAETVCNKILSSAKEAWFKEWADMELINIYQRQNKLAELAVKFENDLSQSPKDIAKYRKLAELYQRNNELDKAVGIYEKAIAAGLDDRDTNNRLLDSYERASKFDKAEEQLRKIIGMAPDDNYLYERLANLLSNAGKKDDAKKTWGQLLSKLPNDAGAYSRYGDRLMGWGDADSGIAQYRKAQSLDPKNMWYTMRIADMLIGKEKFDAAKKELNDIISKTEDQWLKQEAGRKIKDIEARISIAKPAVPAVAAQPVQPEVKAPAVSAVAPAPAKAVKPAEKKKDLL